MTVASYLLKQLGQRWGGERTGVGNGWRMGSEGGRRGRISVTAVHTKILSPFLHPKMQTCVSMDRHQQCSCQLFTLAIGSHVAYVVESKENHYSPPPNIQHVLLQQHFMLWAGGSRIGLPVSLSDKRNIRNDRLFNSLINLYHPVVDQTDCKL